VIAIANDAASDVLTLYPSRDNTIFEEPDTALSNGRGHHLFAGTPSHQFFRRGLILFPVADHIPMGSVINNVILTMHVSLTNTGDQKQFLYGVLADWGEGDSDADGPEGKGAPAALGDATWLFRYYPTVEWNTPGGDITIYERATGRIGFEGFWSWASLGMKLDVQSWVDDPGSNFGWMIIGDETLGKKYVKRYDSREHPDISRRPLLTVDFTPPTVAVTLSTWGRIKALYIE